MSLLTEWGYIITDPETVPPMMSLAEYETLTGRHDNVDRVAAEIDAACAAIRNYVGWHLSPSASCKLKTIVADRRVSYNGNDILIQLPTRYLTSVESVEIDGIAYELYYADPNGLLKIFDVCQAERYAEILVIYAAGLPDSRLAPIKELIAHRVTHAIAVPPGITSEASGGVSVTYNAAWINNSRATALPGDNKEILIPYKVQGVF